ncbi:MAG: hypothetical protein IKT98_09765 [Selenomonadaceae bacterium]|nr:hypothetical protein [Selenomonadaceae bacterium]
MRLIFDLQRFDVNYNNNVMLNGTSGNDTIENSGNYVTIQGFEGNDYVHNYGNDPAITAWSAGKYALITAGDGNDSVDNSGANSVIDGGNDNDSINNTSYGINSTITGGTGSDSIYNSGESSKIYGGDGDDTITNTDLGGKVSLFGNNDNDFISTYNSDSVSIDGGADNDTIDVRGAAYGVTVTGGTGDDSIKLSGGNNLVQYTTGDGNDIITNFSEKDSLKIGDGTGTYSTTKSGSDIIVTVGEGKITLNGAANLSIVNISGEYINFVNNDKSNTVFNGTDGKDSLDNSFAGVTINGLGGNDSINNNTGGDFVSIAGGADDDYIWNYANNVTINGGAGNDTFDNRGNNVTVIGGTGNDFFHNDPLSGGADSVKFDCGAGNDTLNNFGTKITVLGGDGNDIITNCDKGYIDGELRFENKGINSIIDGGKGNDTIDNRGSKVTITGGKGNDSIENSGAKVLFKYSSGDGNDKINGFRADSTLSIGGGSYSTKKSGDDIIVTVGKSKITLNGAASLSKVNIIGEEIAGEENSWKINGTTATYGTDSKTLVTVTGVKSTKGLRLNDKVVTVAKSSVNASKIAVSKGYTLAIADDVPKPTNKNAAWSYKNNVATYKSSSTTAGYTLAKDSKSITYSKAKSASTLATINGVTSKKGIKIKNKVITVSNSIIGASKNISLNGNGYGFNFNASNTAIKGGAGNDTVKVSGSKTTITGDNGNDLISLSSAAKNNVIVYNSGDGNDTIRGFDSNDSLKIASGTAKVTTSGNDVIFTVGKGKITIKDAKDKTFKYVVNGDTKTYSAVSEEPYIINAAKNAITLTSSYPDKDFDVTEAIDNGSEIVTIDASATEKGINITGNGKANKIIGGKGNDTLEGDVKSDTLTGGDGADVFVYYNGSGNDVITDYALEDKISVASGTISSIGQSGIKDVVLKVGKGTIKINKALTVGITYIDKDGIEHDYKNGKQTVSINGKAVEISEDYWKNSFKVDNFAKNIKTIDASHVKRTLSITGNAINNSIVGTAENDYIDAGAGNDTIFGGDGNDTLIGGKGNDTLQGNAGKDVFIYSSGDGEDLIVDYKQNEDIIQIKSGTISDGYANSDGDVVLKVGSSGRITVKDGKDKVITIKYKDGEKTVTTTQSYAEKSPSNADSMWFLAEDDDFTTDNQLSAIVQNNTADYSFLTDSTQLAKENNLIAYAGKK